ncbi:MAG: hypothetical protein ACE5G8_04830, partial [Anaerolineae bacterium]
AAAKLLIDTVPNLCYTCHGNSAAGADTNVVDGLYADTPDGVTEAPAEGVVNRGLKAGGFANATMDTNFNGAAASLPTTSSHIADGSTGTAWGNGANGSGAGAAAFSLSCVSCHDPHGRAGTLGGATYRLLRAVPLNSGAAGGVDVADEANKTYTVASAANQYFGEGYAGANSWVVMDAEETALSAWCAQCHTRYLATSGSGSTPLAGEPIFSYRHMVSGAPGATCNKCHDFVGGSPPYFLITTGGPEYHHYVECMTCHVAHGTTATMSGFAGTVAWPDGATAPNGSARSSLLRGDGRGVCQRCHGK